MEVKRTLNFELDFVTSFLLLSTVCVAKFFSDKRFLNSFFSGWFKLGGTILCREDKVSILPKYQSELAIFLHLLSSKQNLELLVWAKCILFDEILRSNRLDLIGLQYTHCIPFFLFKFIVHLWKKFNTIYSVLQKKANALFYNNHNYRYGLWFNKPLLNWPLLVLKA